MPPAYLDIELVLHTDNRCRVTLTWNKQKRSAEVQNPFSESEITEYLSILRRLHPAVTRAEEAQAARQLGTGLFNFLIKSSARIYEVYSGIIQRIGHNDLVIRLATENAGLLAALPWELLRDPERDFLAVSRQLQIVRHVDGLPPRPAVPLLSPLRVLATHSLSNQIHEAVQTGHLPAASLSGFRCALNQEDYHILHLVSPLHSSPLMVDDGAALPVPDLGREIGETSTIRLLILETPVPPSLQDDLLRIGLTAVLTLQFPIEPAARQVFLNALYSSLTEWQPVHTAVHVARRALANSFTVSDWASPVLRLRSQDGVLFRSLTGAS